MTQSETDSSLRAKIGYLETRNAYEHHDLTSQIEVLQIQVERLEAELEDRPMVFAIQHIETKKLSDRGDSVDIYASVEADLMSFFGVTQELLDDLRRKAIKAKIVEDNRSSVMMEFSEPEIDLILTFKPAMILAIVDRIEMLEAELAEWRKDDTA